MLSEPKKWFLGQYLSAYRPGDHANWPLLITLDIPGVYKVLPWVYAFTVQKLSELRITYISGIEGNLIMSTLVHLKPADWKQYRYNAVRNKTVMAGLQEKAHCVLWFYETQSVVTHTSATDRGLMSLYIVIRNLRSH